MGPVVARDGGEHPARTGGRGDRGFDAEAAAGICLASGRGRGLGDRPADHGVVAERAGSRPHLAEPQHARRSRNALVQETDSGIEVKSGKGSLTLLRPRSASAALQVSAPGIAAGAVCGRRNRSGDHQQRICGIKSQSRSCSPLSGRSLPAAAQNRIDPQSTMHITLPEDSPVALLSAGWGDSTATPRGGAMLLELHTSLTFRNTDQKRVRGITLLVTAQDVTPGGKASVSVPSLNVGPGEVFPVRIDLRLLRPLTNGNGPLAEVSARRRAVRRPVVLRTEPSELAALDDGVGDGGAARPPVLQATARPRNGEEGLRSEMLASLSRQADRAAGQARVAQAPRATNLAGERQVQFAFLDMPGAPVQTEGGMVRISANELRSPRVFLTNRSGKGIRGIEMGWLVKDSQGREYVAGAIPIEVGLAPHMNRSVVQDVDLQAVAARRQAARIEDMHAYLTSVEFEDGKIWIPARTGPDDHAVARGAAAGRTVSQARHRGTGAGVEQVLMVANLERFVGRSPDSLNYASGANSMASGWPSRSTRLRNSRCGYSRRSASRRETAVEQLVARGLDPGEVRIRAAAQAFLTGRLLD